MPFKTEHSSIATLLAVISGLMFAIGAWFVFTAIFSVRSDLAVTLSVLIGVAEFYVLRYVLSQKYVSTDEKS